MSDSLQPHELQHARPPCPSPTPGVHSDSRPLSPWCHPAISSSAVPFSSCPQSLPASESFPMSQLFACNNKKYITPLLTLSRGALLMSVSEVFSVPFHTWIKLCYTKALEWSILFPGPEAKSSALEIKNSTPSTVSNQYDQSHHCAFVLRFCVTADYNINSRIKWSCNSRHAYLVPDLKERAFNISSLNVFPVSPFFCKLFNWRLITLQYCSGFCHTLTWISHGCTCVPHPEPPPTCSPSRPSGSSQCPSPERPVLCRTWTGDLFHIW